MTDKEIKAYKAKLRREANPEIHRAQVKAWKERNREKWLAIRRAYYQRCKARIIAKNMEWAKTNPEKVKAIRKAYELRRKTEPTHA